MFNTYPNKMAALAAITIGCLSPYLAFAQWSETVEGEVIITGGWLFDGTGTDRRPNPGIVIRNGKFKSVGSFTKPTPSENTVLIELDSAETILPGMIDTLQNLSDDVRVAVA